MSQLTLQDCITSKTRRAGDHVKVILEHLEHEVSASHMSYLAAIESPVSGTDRVETRSAWNQAVRCLDAAKSAL